MSSQGTAGVGDYALGCEVLLASLRSGGQQAAAARAELAFPGRDARAEERERSAMRRAEVSALLAASLRPTDKPLARWLLEQEVAAHEAAGHGASETLFTLVAAVARYADPDDVLLLWRARQTTPETRTGVDVEQAFRGGVERVRRRLQTMTRQQGTRAREAAEALEWLESGVSLGAAEDLPGYFAWADERFGLHISGPT
ncbi:MAG: hypothetical protein ACXWQR_16420 [Ktedonobacterales bacterium]